MHTLKTKLAVSFTFDEIHRFGRIARQNTDLAGHYSKLTDLASHWKELPRESDTGEEEETKRDRWRGKRRVERIERNGTKKNGTVSRYLPARHLTLSLSFAWVSSTGHRGFDFADHASRSASKLHRRSNKLECTRPRGVRHAARYPFARHFK